MHNAKGRPMNRRTFLMGSAALAAAGVVRPARASANERIATAIIGCRNRGHQVADSFVRSGQFDIVSMCDCDSAMAERGLAQLGDRLERAPDVEEDFRRVLERRDVDAVVIATPDHWHAAMCNLALDAGKHVYLEKPASFDIADGAAMVNARAKRPELTVLIGTQQRSGAHFREARDFVREGGLGKVGFARAWISHDRGVLPIVPDSPPPDTLNYGLWLGPAPERPYNESRVHYWWRFIRDYGTGEMGNWGAHWLDIVRWYLDLDVPRSAAAFGGNFVVQDAKEFPDTQTVLYDFPDLTVLWELRLWTGQRVNALSSGAEFGGDKGSLVVSRRGWTYYPKNGEPVQHESSEMERAHAVNFAESIRGGAAPSADIVDGHKTSVMCHLGNMAARLNRQISFDPASETCGTDAEANALLGRPYRGPWRL